MPKWTDEQLHAINDEGTNIIVSAGAGSGKTAVLTERVITKIKKGVPVNKLLILTFTKAAANEMKERIRSAIKNEGIWEQLDLLDAAYITTFDSFALSVVKKYHYLINVSKNVNIGDDNIFRIEKDRILDEIFERLYAENNSEFMKLINDFCVKDDNEIREYILNIRSKLDMKVDSEEYLKQYLSNYYNKENIENFVIVYMNILQNKISLLKELLVDISYYVDADYYQKLEETLAPLLDSKTYTDIKSNLNSKLPQLPRGSDEEVKIKKDNINNLIKVLKELTIYESPDQIESSINMTKDYAKIIVDILLEFDAKIKDFKFENDIYEFNDIAILAIKILQDNVNVREELKNYFNEILIDEYQDTSDIQETFINLISNNNVYMVGDIKQSIYRFRNANPYIFKNKYDSYAKNICGKKIDLNKNFRSRSEVIDNINLLFSYLMGDNIGGANYKESHEMIFGNTAYLENGNCNMNILTYDELEKFSKNEVEAFIIADDIKNKINSNYLVFDKQQGILRSATYGDFVILMDRATDFELYKKIFEYLNIPLQIYKDEILNNEIDTIVLSNLLYLIKLIKEKTFDNSFRYYFTSIARSFLFRLSDQEIFEINRDGTYYEQHIFLKCKSVADSLDYLNPTQLVETVINEFKFYENIIKIGDISAAIKRLDYILKLSYELMDFGYNAYDFINYLNKINGDNYEIKYSGRPENIDAVKIMTIHKSKGLEYPICYFSGLYKKFNISDLKERILFDNDLGIILPYFNEGMNDSIVKTILKESFIKEEISEKIRLFYVALTRSREKIILVLPNCEDNIIVEKELSDNEKLKYRSLADMINSANYVLDQFKKNVDLDTLGITKDYNFIDNKTLVSNDSDYKRISVTEVQLTSGTVESSRFSKAETKLFTKEEYKNIQLGLELHKILENIDFHNPDYSLISNDYHKTIVKKFFSHIDINSDTKVYQEYEFMYYNDNEKHHGIIDLMLESSDHIKIVDYKLKNVSDEAYEKQLNGYKNYIESVTDKPVEIYLYSIIDSKLQKLA